MNYLYVEATDVRNALTRDARPMAAKTGRDASFTVEETGYTP